MSEKTNQYPLPPDCERGRELLSTQLDRELDQAEQSQLESHLRGCDDCRGLAPWFEQV